VAIRQRHQQDLERGGLYLLHRACPWILQERQLRHSRVPGCVFFSTRPEPQADPHHHESAPLVVVGLVAVSGGTRWRPCHLRLRHPSSQAGNGPGKVPASWHPADVTRIGLNCAPRPVVNGDLMMVACMARRVRSKKERACSAGCSSMCSRCMALAT
jgi:hypothetical protein